MKNTITFILLFWAVLLSHNTFAQPTESKPELSEDPQALSVENAPTDALSEEPPLENPPNATNSTESSAPVTENPVVTPEAPPQVKAESEPVESAEKKEIKAEEKAKIQVVDEDELLKPAKTKITPEAKVRSQKISESEIYIQEADKYKVVDTFKNLQLNDVIEQGLRKNYQQNIRYQLDQANEIQFSGAKSAFWMPDLKINLTTANQKIGMIHSGSAPSSPNPTIPSGSLGLSLGEYTVFNWGKDYALYLNKKSNYERTKQIFDESKRELKLELIATYFSLMSTKNIEKIRQDQLRQASFIYRLNKEKITIGKTSKQDYYLARTEYLAAQDVYHEAKRNSDIADEKMSFLIADEIGTKYVINENLDYIRIKLTLDDSLNFSKRNNPTLLNNKTEIENAERSYDIALKENMPLPKFTMNLGAYTKKFGPTTNSTLYETYGGGSNVELVASLNASWAITGEDGLFNSNKLALSRLKKEISLKDFEKNQHFTQSLVRQTYKNILSLQNQIVILEAKLPAIQKTFDIVLENYLANKAKYYDFHLALLEFTETKILYEEIKLQHLNEKLTLAKLTGLEDFPGENFEQLAIRVKGK